MLGNVFYIIQNIFNTLDKCFLELNAHILISDSHVIFIIWIPYLELGLSSWASSLFPGSFEELPISSLQSGHFYWLQISSVSCHSENFLPLYNLPPNSFPSPQKFYPRADTIYSSMLIQEDFPYPCQKVRLCQMEFLYGVLSESCLPVRGAAKELSAQPH